MRRRYRGLATRCLKMERQETSTSISMLFILVSSISDFLDPCCIFDFVDRYLKVAMSRMTRVMDPDKRNKVLASTK